MVFSYIITGLPLLNMSNLEETSPAPARAAPSLARRLAWLGLIFALILLVVLAAAAYAGYQAGLSQRQIELRATQTAELGHQYDLGAADLAAGRYEVAVARFEYILLLDPAYRDASQKLAEARQALQATATPAPTATAPATPAPTKTHAAAEALAQAQALLNAGDWGGAIEAVALLHSIDPNYEKVKADGLLYLALRNRGVERIKGDGMEAGIFDLDQAEAFGPLDNEASDYRAWARLYLAAQSFWGVNWKQTMDILEQLYPIAPYFHDTASHLFEATVHYADELVAAGDFCAAAERYGAALSIAADEAVSSKLAAAQENCSATPAPTPSPTP